jgi:hypothetical protein
VTAGQEFASSATAFAGDQAGGEIDLDTSGSRQTIQPFKNEYASLDWVITGRRTAITFDVAWSDHDYGDSADLNQTMVTFGASVRRDLTAALNVSLNYDQSESDFEVTGDYSDQLVGLELNWQMSRMLSLGFVADRYDRSSDLTGGDYTENRFWLSLNYGRGVPRSRMGATQTPEAE